MICEDYVSFEIAKLLKKKGFDEPCEYFYEISPEDGILRICGTDCHDNTRYDFEFSRPTLQMVMKWLREIYKLEVRSTYDYDKDSWWGSINPMYEETDKNTDIYQKALRFDYQGKSYEEACEAVIEYCLENLI